MEENKISVIIPVYNVEKYLEKCVRSVFNQTYKNLEIILVDDGAKDSSGEICDRLKEIDSRIKVIHKENGGLSSARNEGLKIATGDYIGFLDSDDYIIPYFYEYLLKLIKENNADIAEGEFLRIPEELYDQAEKIIEEENSKKQEKIECSTSEEALELLYGVKVVPYVKKVVVWNKLYKKSVLKNITFTEGKLHEDEFTTHRRFYNAKKIVSSNKIIHGYMQTKNSIMRTVIKQKRIDDTLDSITYALRFFYDKKMPKLEAKIMMRYLEYCIELSGKISKEESDDKDEKLQILRTRFDLFYENINNIKKYVSNELEERIIQLLEKAYNRTENNNELYYYWDELSKIIN